ncbi:MAG: hypothetical protein FJ319_13810 [SAR202 cluster bacterium]|nr:hypothetical protein [SAR202 cluster bacterium]
MPAGYKLTQLAEATGGQLCIGVGWSLPQLIESLDRGAHFLTTASVNRPFVKVMQLHRASRRKEAIDLFNATLPFVAFKQQHLDISLNILKRYCVRRGIFKTAKCRDPILPFDAHHERLTQEVLDGIIALEDSLR